MITENTESSKVSIRPLFRQACFEGSCPQAVIFTPLRNDYHPDSTCTRIQIGFMGISDEHMREVKEMGNIFSVEDSLT